jgi:hypothetical protein
LEAAVSTDFNIRPVGTPAPSQTAPPLRAAAADAVATELPARASVTVADPTLAVRNDPQTGGNGPLSHQVVLDPEAASIVFQVVDDRTNLVIRQFPDDAMLRRRAYFHTLDVMKADRAPLAATDRKA